MDRQGTQTLRHGKAFVDGVDCKHGAGA
jgi:hypothetical protein